jgi:hypothetical protein
MRLNDETDLFVGEGAECSLLLRSTLYREFLAEREEILRHKWIESEKAGHDIGFEHALTNWLVHHCAQWRRERRSQITHRSTSEACEVFG